MYTLIPDLAGSLLLCGGFASASALPGGVAPRRLRTGGEGVVRVAVKHDQVFRVRARRTRAVDQA